MTATNQERLPLPKTTKQTFIGGKIFLLNTTFLFDLKIILILWPLWWLLGIDQFFFPFFIAWEFFRHILLKPRLKINWTIRWSFLLLLWWLTPVLWVPPELFKVYLKEFATISTQFMILLLLWNNVKTHSDWRQLIQTLIILAFYSIFGALVFVFGLWRGQIPSVVGTILPKSITNSSSFFSSVAIRSFGSFSSELDGVLSYRVSSFLTSYSALSLAILAIFPFLWWKAHHATWKLGIFYGFLMIGAIVSLVFTESRIAYGAFVIEFGLLVGWSIIVAFKKNSRHLIVLLIMLLSSFVFVALIPFIPDVIEKVQWSTTQWRPGSFTARTIIYTETFRLLPEHLITGWGVPIRISGIFRLGPTVAFWLCCFNMEL